MKLLLVLATCVLAVSAEAQQMIQYGAFLQTATYSIANQLGFFAANNLTVIYNQVPNSTAAFDSLLISGQYDILTATVDNALNYRLNQARNATVLGQLDQGPGLVLASVPSITSIAQLRGKPIIVDSPVSGYAYLLRKILSAQGGLELRNGDYYFMTVGGTAARYAALLNGKLPNGTDVHATILNYPFTAQAQALANDSSSSSSARPNILGAIADVVAPITSSALTVREASPSDAATTERLTRFVQSMLAANRLLRANTSRTAPCAVRAIAAQLNVTLDVARAEYASAVDRVTGEVSPDGAFGVSGEGIRNVVEVRRDYGGFGGVPAGFDFEEALVPGKGKLIDYGVRDEALRREEVAPLKGTCSCA